MVYLFPARISEPEHPFERMLAVVRFAFTKDLKFVVRTSRLHSQSGFSTWNYQLIAWQSMQTLQLGPRGALPSTLGCPPGRLSD